MSIEKKNPNGDRCFSYGINGNGQAECHWPECGCYPQAQQPAALAVSATNVTPMRQPRADLARLVESINAAVYANGNGLSVTEAIGALELAKLELLREQEQ